MGVFLVQDCAQISAPTGGNPDTKPPMLDTNGGTIPENYSTNFNGDKIVMVFNEYFVLKNPTANVFFSPSLEYEPEFIVKGKTLTVLLNNVLKENTTYTINFGDAISDYTVGNKIPDFKYVFSTGDFIDSMVTKGKVIDAFSGKAIERVLVMLYEDTSDSIVSKNIPTYYSVTDKEGNYSMSYIKAGTYKMFALKDENRNYLYDLPNESVGEPDSLISLLSDTIPSNYILSMYTKDYKKQGIKTKKYSYPGKLVLTFVKPAKEISFYKSDSTKLQYNSIEINKKRDSVIIWQPNLDSAKTSLRIKLDTTTEAVNIYPYRVPKKEAAVKSISRKRSVDYTSPFEIEFNRPIDHTDNLAISIKKDSNQMKIDSMQIKGAKLLLFFNKKADESYRFQFLPGAITDIFNSKNSDTISGYITVLEKDYYGSFLLKLNPKNDSVSYLISILDDKGKTIESKTTKGNSQIKFSQLPPGKYSIKAIEDKNSNGKWDTGNYYEKLKPEQVFYFPSQIEIRSNWELAEGWEL